VPAARHVAARVSAALADEPSFGAPAGRRWIRPAAGLAVAASVALATVLLLPQWLGSAQDDGAAMTAAVDPLAASPAEVVPVVMAGAEEEPVVTYTTPPAPAEPAGALPSAQLAAYLVAHSEYTLPLSRRSVVTTLPEKPAEQAGTETAKAGR
jgi:sigma-E factor negative regulatory protein RseA